MATAKKTFTGYSYASGESRDGKIVDEYIYDDNDGNPYHLIQRMDVGEDRHKFPQSHWVRSRLPGEKSRWEPGEPTGKKFPYNLPSIIKSDPSEPIWICEGEKDADNVSALGLISTTNPGGAGKWTKDLNKWFRGRKGPIYVLEDNDTPGRKHAFDVINSLKSAKIACVYQISLPGLPHKEDVSWWLANGGSREELLEVAKAAEAGFRNRTTIMIPAGDQAAVLKETEDALIRVGAPIFIRGGSELVEPIWHDYKTADGGKVRLTSLKTLTPNSLCHIVNRDAAFYMRYDARSKKEVFINPPLSIMMQLIEKGHWSFRPIAGTINAPTMRPDGSIFAEAGYDDMTRLWRWADDDIEVDVPEFPTKRQALNALDLIKELFSEVAFASPTDRSVAIAALITAVVRGAFDMAPMFLFRAHSSGTGKSYLVDIISHVVQGRWCPVISLGSKEETEKRLGTLLLEAPPLVSVDNLEQDLRSETLCQMVERPLVKIRILGKSQMPECEWRGVLFATGNNVNLVADMVRRGLTCQLDAPLEDPWKRKFKFDALKRVRENRSKYINAAFTIVLGFLRSKNSVDVSFDNNSFPGWTEFVQKPLVWLGEPDPCTVIDRAKNEDPSRLSAKRFIMTWVDAVEKNEAGWGKQMRATDIIALAMETKSNPVMGANAPELIYLRPEFHEVLTDVAQGPRGSIDSRRLGWWLRSLTGRVFFGYRVYLRSKQEKGNIWSLEQVGEDASAEA